MFDYDVIIIGAGVCGTAIARELSRYQVRIGVLEKEEDVCCGTSKANSAIIHAGFDAPEGSLMAKLNVRGNEMMDKLSRDLDFPFKRNGSLVLCLNEEDRPKLETLYERGIANGVKELKILERDEVLKLEENLSDEVSAALHAPTGGIVCPFQMNIAFAENAHANGVEFYFDTEVENIEKLEEGFAIKTKSRTFKAKYVVNAAGVHADRLHNMVSTRTLRITPRKGEYCLLDKAAGKLVSRTIFSLPGRFGKGVLVTPTIHGNLLMGPTATDISDKEGTNTTREGLEEVLKKTAKSVKNIPVKQIITSFAGLRAHEEGREFIIEEAEDARGFIDCAGIQSPGLSSCPAIGEMVAQLLKEKMQLKEKESFIFTRTGMLNPKDLSLEERNRLIRENPAYGTIVCRCEMVTEGEIVDAITRPLGARSLDGVKRRTRAGMGRCQSGFCSPRTMEILAERLDIHKPEVTKMGAGSELILGTNKDTLEDKE
ncbi:MAG: NAD(P)/FAD-dependent oxidoreductase [Lachnospiraceae bacterium]|nr:NAD(P)/FAD-dependent oxidoreductase [Lachnospiraceae bacterium]